MSKRKAEQSNAAASKMLDDVEAFGDWEKTILWSLMLAPPFGVQDYLSSKVIRRFWLLPCVLPHFFRIVFSKKVAKRLQGV